jgi:hypothetical protein
MAKRRKAPSSPLMALDLFSSSRYMPKAYRQRREAERSLDNLAGRKSPSGKSRK